MDNSGLTQCSKDAVDGKIQRSLKYEISLLGFRHFLHHPALEGGGVGVRLEGVSNHATIILLLIVAHIGNGQINVFARATDIPIFFVI
jgi:hypothetical protein